MGCGCGSKWTAHISNERYNMHSPSYCINTARPAEETQIDQGKDGQTNNHEDEPQWGGLHPAAAAADDDNDDDSVTRSVTDTAC